MKIRISYTILFSFFILFIIFSCKSTSSDKDDNEVNDFERIKKKGTLTILTISGSDSYFLYREQPMGFHYDIANEFCKANNLELEVKLANSPVDLIRMLERGEGDLIAYPLPVINEFKDSITYCGINLISHQVIVQSTDRSKKAKDVPDLIGKKITVASNSKYAQRLENLNSELGGGIEIDTSIGDSLAVEDLIEKVSKRELECTVADEYIAKLNKTYFTNIDISLPISFDQRSSWAVAKESTHLADSLNAWDQANTQTPIYRAISKRYFELSKRAFSEQVNFLKKLPKGQISPYDDLFKKYAEGTPYEWQLLAAIGYRESRFKNNVTSWAGATGIMGIMPRTGRQYGATIDQLSDPDTSIQIAIKLMIDLNKILSDIEDPQERLKFVLAAYNGGIGHITDLRALAEKHGSDKNIWEGHVRNWVTKKRDPVYYNDPVCKSGYFRGTETLNYVSGVLRTTELFKKKVKS